jgi:hypothetical protein
MFRNKLEAQYRRNKNMQRNSNLETRKLASNAITALSAQQMWIPWCGNRRYISVCRHIKNHDYFKCEVGERFLCFAEHPSGLVAGLH